MHITCFDVRYRKIYPKDIIKYTGVYNVDTFRFNFDEEWDGLVKTLTIIVGDTTYNVPLIEDEAILPKEAYVKDKRVAIGIYGSGEDKLLATELIDLIMSKGAYEEGKEPENLPTPSQWDLYIEQINAIVKNVEELTSGLEDKVSEVETKLANGEFKGDKGDKGDQGDKGDRGIQGEKGEPGYTPVKGIDYYTETEKQEFVKEVLDALPIAEEVGY